jgi:hypothetical protein
MVGRCLLFLLLLIGVPLPYSDAIVCLLASHLYYCQKMKMYKSLIFQHEARRQTLLCLVFLILCTEAFIAPERIRWHKTLLRNKESLDYDDFGSYGDTELLEKEAQEWTKEFYKEVRLREARNTLASDAQELDARETYESSPFISPSSTTDNTTPLSVLLSFFHPPPPPSSSAGLFSGNGKGPTAYSSGRSARAEVQLLESSLNKHKGARIIGWDGLYIDSKPDQLEQILKAAAGTVVVLSVAYLATELAGGLAIVFPWEGEIFTPMAGEIAKDGISSILIVLGDGFEHVGSLVIGDAASLGQALAHSMEELILR